MKRAKKKKQPLPPGTYFVDGRYVEPEDPAWDAKVFRSVTRTRGSLRYRVSIGATGKRWRVHHGFEDVVGRFAEHKFGDREMIWEFARRPAALRAAKRLRAIRWPAMRVEVRVE